MIYTFSLCFDYFSDPLKTVRIMANSNDIVSLGAIFDGAVIFYKMIAGSVFCEVLHSEAIRRKRDSTHQDVRFRMHFVAFGVKKCEAEAGALYASRCDVFKKTFHCL